MAGEHTPYKKIVECYSDQGEDSTVTSSENSSGKEEYNTEYVPRPDPITWFNSIPINTPSSAIPTTSAANKRPSTPFNVNCVTPPMEKCRSP